MHHRLRQFSRKLHLWGALLVFIPVCIVIVSGLLLQVKKEVDWIQPPTQKSTPGAPTITFAEIYASLQARDDIDETDWSQIQRLDVRPDKGIIKVILVGGTEVQLDGQTGAVKQIAQRRSDVIEAIHDGSWFFSGAKLWLFLPAAVVLFCIWLSGLVLLFTTLKSRYRKRRYHKLQGLD